MDILIAVITLGSLGVIFGVGLAAASKKLAVRIDPRLEKVHGLLPGSNCGSCGGAGCFGFAEMLLSGKADVSACRVSEEGIKEKIAQLLGKPLEKQVKRVAVLHCNGGVRVQAKYHYDGLQDCVAANLVLGGPKECFYGCLGLGTCARICPFGAIRMNKDGLPEVITAKCKACNKCVEICPKKLFSLIPVTHPVYVACRSHDIGKDTRAVCSVGCIACRKCEQICPVKAITVIDNVAVIDYQKCISCGKCVEACPVKAIRKRE